MPTTTGPLVAPGTYTVYDRRQQPILTGFPTNDDARDAARIYRTEHPGSSPLIFLTPTTDNEGNRTWS